MSEKLDKYEFAFTHVCLFTIVLYQVTFLKSSSPAQQYNFFKMDTLVNNGFFGHLFPTGDTVRPPTVFLDPEIDRLPPEIEEGNTEYKVHYKVIL